MTMPQLSLFAQAPPEPEGMRYEPDFLSGEEERALLEGLPELPFREFEFHGYRGLRRVVSFGWQFDFNTNELRRTDDIPTFLLPLRERAARWIGLAASDLQHVLLTEYGPGAGIGWHKDRPVFADVIGLSLRSPCLFRLRRRTGRGFERVSRSLEPRSAYALQGSARTDWEHSIPAVDELRYSITFRNFRNG